MNFQQGQAYYQSSKMQVLQDRFVHPPVDYEQELLEAIRMGDEATALQVMRKINELEAAVLATYPLRSKKNALIASCTLFTRAIIQGGVDPEIAFHLSDTLILEIEKLNDLEALAQFEYEMLVQFVMTIQREREELPYSHLVKLAIHYIRQHIFDDLTLPHIANHLGVHPSYLSDRFRRETGVPLMKYINSRKIEESKYMLIYTNRSISEVAFHFKFCNQSYYTRLFKEFVGMTPKQFRTSGAGRSILERSL
ncbi:AraC family transcriptional regulator [Paenibacillus barengoltzii]|uniref:helix-turn-helix domain-containing protein n=1 Tax=Paenibacillus barengoltzii TaxID=343517 RepID=UPI002DB59290|nr:AraC family transcriptional regulator [Paenibacillus barengoltzii]MEC2346178.1 AraC family transcriptional regulator [Paenibacillus barengoltzii]